MTKPTKFLILILIGSVIILLALVVTGCDECCSSEYRRFQLQDGTIVECKGYSPYHGSSELYDCKDGRVYHQQTNIVELPGGVK